MVNKTTIQAVAQRTGLSTHTLRWYEKIGLIPHVEREANGHRSYTDEDVKLIKYITRLRATGMPLEEIKYYLELPHSDATVLKRLYMLQQQREVIQNKIAELNEMLNFVDRKINHYYEKHVASLVAESDKKIAGD